MSAYFVPDNSSVQLFFQDITVQQTAALVATLIEQSVVMPLPMDGVEESRIRILNFGQIPGGLVVDTDNVEGVVATITLTGGQGELASFFEA